MEETLVDLETRIAYQDQTIEDLSQRIIEQQKQIDEMDKLVKKINSQLLSNEASGVVDSSLEVPPPHY